MAQLVSLTLATHLPAGWLVIYLVDSAIQHLNNWDQN